MKDYNNQIMNYWRQKEVSSSRGSNEQTWTIIQESMQFLKFAYPVRNDEELNEVVKLCVLYHNLQCDPELLLDKFKTNSKVFDVSLSLTDRCGYMCRHCSTNATLAKDKISVPFEALTGALSEMTPRVRFLFISCEGDPFYYESPATSGKNATAKKDIVDVMRLLLNYKFNRFSIQSLAPTAAKFHLLEDILSIINQVKGRDVIFLPQISFNLYPLRAGLKTRVRVNEEGYEFNELYIPSVRKNEVREWLARLISASSENTTNTNTDRDNEGTSKLTELKEVSTKLLQYLNDVRSTILAYASRGYKIHFEIRGDTFSEFTNLKTMEVLLDTLLEELAKKHPEITFPRCTKCLRIHYEKNFAHIVPLGRGIHLFPNGVHEEKVFFDKHVKMNPYKYLCDNWMSWGSMIIDTKGFPQLCYSNLALTPKARTTRGSNLYRDGFEKICDFYIRVWEDRINFLKQNLPDLVRQRPNNHFCPLILFKQTLSEFT